MRDEEDQIKTCSVMIVLGDDEEDASHIISAAQNCTRIGFGMEGVDLSRDGTSCIMQLAFKDQILVIDVLNKPKESRVIAALKSVLEDPSILKIIHDCRMDSDALMHHFDITLRGVWDTSVAHDVLTDTEDANLDDILTFYKLKPNSKRDRIVYKHFQRFWETRPLTKQMIEWVSGDLASILLVQKKQMDRIRKTQKNCVDRVRVWCEEIEKKSQMRATWVTKASTRVVTVDAPGRLIGTGGRNLRLLQGLSDTLIRSHGPREDHKFRIYYYPESYEDPNLVSDMKFLLETINSLEFYL